jgi:hypothetical protein
MYLASFLVEEKIPILSFGYAALGYWHQRGGLLEKLLIQVVLCFHAGIIQNVYGLNNA